MEYKKIERQHYNIHLIESDKFKKIAIQAFFRNDVKKENITKNNVLSLVLSDSNNTYKTNRELMLEYERLYSMSAGFSHGVSGKVMSLVAGATLLDPKYTETGLLTKALDLLFDLIYNPNVKDNLFDEKSFDLAIRSIKREIISIEENPNTFASEKLLESMDDQNGLLSYHRSGYLEDVELITKDNLYKYYLDVINNNVLDIVVSGNINSFDIVNYLDLKLKDINNPKKELTSSLFHDEFLSDYKTVKFNRKTSQSVLKIGFKIENMTVIEKEIVATLYSIILGGGFESKLFQNVREKNSLCYRIGSTINRHVNISTITAGISAINYEKALSLCLLEVEEMRLGNISEKEFTTAVKVFETALEMDEESLASIINSNMSKYFEGSLLPSERLELLGKVTVDDIKNLANKIHIDTVLLLEGDDLVEEN